MSKRGCRFCFKFQFNLVNVLLILFVCAVVYVGHYFDMKEHRQKIAQRAQERALEFDRLQEECFFKNMEQSCQTLQKINNKINATNKGNKNTQNIN